MELERKVVCPLSRIICFRANLSFAQRVKEKDLEIQGKECLKPKRNVLYQFSIASVECLCERGHIDQGVIFIYKACSMFETTFPQQKNSVFEELQNVSSMHLIFVLLFV